MIGSNIPGTWKIVTIVGLFLLVMMVSEPLWANSATDWQGVTWTVTRAYNSDPPVGWDIKVTTDEQPPVEYWITRDALGDNDPYIQIDPHTDTASVFWSKRVLGGYMIHESHFDGNGFTTPANISLGGIGFLDTEPHFCFENDGDIHLVFCRARNGETGKAMYLKFSQVWGRVQQYSRDEDDVTGSTFIVMVNEATGQLTTSYEFGAAQTRYRCRGADPCPWEMYRDSGDPLPWDLEHEQDGADPCPWEYDRGGDGNPWVDCSG